nr:DoxX family protein [Burkholderia sp. IMCC1007]
MPDAQSLYRDIGALAGRVLIAAGFIASGIAKLAWPYTASSYIDSFGLPAAGPGLIFAMLFELACGILMIVGYRTRAVSSVLASYCIATALIFHHTLGDLNEMLHFVKNLMMAGGLLGFSAFGAGKLSIDSRVSRISARRLPIS